MFIIVGLGNPGKEYENSRHNTGRIILDAYAHKNKLDWSIDKKLKALTSEHKIGREKILLLEPETFMNKSGLGIKSLITSKKKAEQLVVIYDDVDLPMGEIKIAFNRGSGGHRGLESIIKTIKTKEFIRVRVGICPTTPAGKMKKPKGENAILDFLLGNFNKKEFEILKNTKTKAVKILDEIISEGYLKAMNSFN
ncbi:MAG: aminoacyl-tRNA hydrolase [Patescibacteria group bacterium]